MKQKTPEKFVSVRNAELIESLLDSALERVEVTPLYSKIINEMAYNYESQLVAVILANKSLSEVLRDEVKAELKAEGYTVVKAGTMEKKSKLEEFVNSVLFPYYNEQQEFILF